MNILFCNAIWLPLHLDLGYALIVAVETRSYIKQLVLFFILLRSIAIKQFVPMATVNYVFWRLHQNFVTNEPGHTGVWAF